MPINLNGDRAVEKYAYFPTLVGTSVTFQRGDMLWWDSANATVKKASAFTWDTSEAITRGQFARLFCGVALESQFADSPARLVKVAIAGLIDVTVTSRTGAPGVMVGPEKQASSNLLENQKLEVGIADPSECIGVVERLYASAVTTMRVYFQAAINGPYGVARTLKQGTKEILLSTVTTAADRLTNMDAMKFFGGPAEVLALGFMESVAITTKPLKLNLERGTDDLATLTVPVTGAAIGRYTEASMAADTYRIFTRGHTISLEIAATAPGAGSGLAIVRYRPLW